MTDIDHRVPLSARDSLRWRLPFLISALIAVVVFSFLGVAYRRVESTLARAGGERAQAAADQVANLLEAAQRTVEESHRIAADADVHRYLLSPTDEAREAARKRLAALGPTGPRRV